MSLACSIFMEAALNLRITQEWIKIANNTVTKHANIWMITLLSRLITHSRGKQTTADKKRSQLMRRKQTHLATIQRAHKHTNVYTRPYSQTMWCKNSQKYGTFAELRRKQCRPAIKITHTHDLFPASHGLHLIYVVSDFTVCFIRD